MLDRLTPVVKNLLIANIAVFFVTQIAKQFMYSNFSFFNPILPGAEELFNPNFKPWQILTYMFMHGGIGHLFSNMFGLFIFGSTLETFMGSKKFLIYYIQVMAILGQCSMERLVLLMNKAVLAMPDFL